MSGDHEDFKEHVFCWESEGRMFCNDKQFKTTYKTETKNVYRKSWERTVKKEITGNWKENVTRS